MNYQTVNDTDAERIFMRFKNVSGGTLTAGYAAVLDVGTQVDGHRVTKPATADLSAFAGIPTRDLADDASGDFQVYGYNSAVFVTNATDQAIAAGDILIPVDAQFHLARSGASDGKSGFVIAAEAFATAATTQVAAANKKAFIRAL